MSGSQWDEVLLSISTSFNDSLKKLKMTDLTELVEFCVRNRHIRQIVEEFLNKNKKINHSQCNSYNHQQNEKDGKKYKPKGSSLKLESKINNTLPLVAGGENGKFASASAYINVFYSKDKGRHVVATHDIEVGDVLFVEKPFAFVAFDSVCHGCCQQFFQSPVKCEKCLQVFYCSEDCKNQFLLSHRFECGFKELFNSIGIAYLSFHIILQACSSINELKKVVAEMENLKEEKSFIEFSCNKYKNVYTLESNCKKYELQDAFQYVLTGLLLALYMKNHTNFFCEASKEGELQFLVQILSKHIMQLICNGHAITQVLEKKINNIKISDSIEERVGTAIYPSASMMNHSCEPSIVNCFSKNFLIVRASKSIKKGEEVFNCYGPHCKRMKRKDRQEILEKQYFFKCKCLPCSQEIDIQEIFTALKCNYCCGPLISIEENCDKRICLNCRNVTCITLELLEKEDRFFSLLKQGEFIHCVEGDFSAVRAFLKIWSLGRNIFYKFHKDLSYAADNVAKCLTVMKDYRRCIMFLKCCILSVEKRYGDFSIELANELKKLGDVSLNYCMSLINEKKFEEMRNVAKEGIQYYQRSHKIMRLLYGSQSYDLEEIEKNLRIMESLMESLCVK